LFLKYLLVFVSESEWCKICRFKTIKETTHVQVFIKIKKGCIYKGLEDPKRTNKQSKTLTTTHSVSKYLSRLIFYVNFDHLFY
jgi:hypothetical protein